MNKVSIITSLLGDTIADVSMINELMLSFKLSSKDCKKIANDFVSNRKNVVSRAKDYSDINDSYLKNFLMLTHYRFSQGLIKDKELYELFQYISNSDLRHDELVSMAIKLASLNQLNIILSKGMKIKESNYFKACRRGMELGNEDIYSQYKEKVTVKAAKKKLSILARYYSDEGISIIDTLEEFKKIDEKYFYSIFNVLDRYRLLLEEPGCLLEARYVTTNNPIISIIKEKIKSKSAFSFIRLSDGEAYGFNDCPRLARRQEMHWWGEELSQGLRKSIKDDFSKSLKNSIDMLGIPTPYKFIHYMDFKNSTTVVMDTELDIKVMNRLLYMSDYMVSSIRKGVISAQYLVEDQINNMVFTKEILNDIASLAKRVIVISGYQENFIRSNFNHHNIVVKEIPTHNLLSSRAETTYFENSLPHIYKEVREWIKNEVSIGDLVLVSGGFIGKIFISDSKESGAIALDVGQSFKFNLYY